MLPYAAGEKEWEYPQIVEKELAEGRMFAPLKRAAAAYGDGRYEAAAEKLARRVEVRPVERLCFPAVNRPDR